MLTASSTNPSKPSAMTDDRDLDRYADLFDDVDVAPGEAERFEALLDEIEAWIAEEENTCYGVTVGVGEVSAPVALTAKMRRLSGENLVTRLLPAEEIYAGRFGVGDPVVLIIASGKVCLSPEADKGERKYSHEKRCMLFRRME